LPFPTPTPLGPVISTPDWTAVAVPWIPGHPAPSGTGDPATLSEVLDGADDSTLSACVEQVVRWMDGDGCD
jgi:hypothetical protein